LRIIILPMGLKDRSVLSDIREGLMEVFPHSRCVISAEELPIPEGAYNPRRGQYLSERLLISIGEYAAASRDNTEVTRFLGVTDVDIYAPGLNFIFGEAEFMREAAIISLYRLRPEFYGDQPDRGLFVERAIKEAVHEIGHTLGLRHCPDAGCVMHFSLHIGMTDRKNKDLCRACRLKLDSCMDS